MDKTILGVGDGDSFAWSRWNSMCSPKKLSGIVFLPHQSQLKYVKPVSLQYVSMWNSMCYPKTLSEIM